MGEKVRIVAVLEVDKEKLAEAGGSFEDEMGRAELRKENLLCRIM